MMKFENISNLYFLGIGGIGMSALARYANNLGKNVAGYDLTSTKLTLKLEAEGIQIHYTDDLAQMPNEFSKENTLVVITPAIPKSLKEYQILTEQGFELVKRSQLLGALTNHENLLAVAGTHGKTSVSTMIAHLLSVSGTNVGAFLGGISKNFNSNLVLPDGNPDFAVTEADEFDRSFLQLTPNVAVITSIDPDHLDIYGTYDAVYEAFSQFAGKVKLGGVLIAKNTINLSKLNASEKTVYSYGLTGEADFTVEEMCIENGAYKFSIVTPWGKVKRCVLKYPGRINVENMLAAVAAVLSAGVNQKSKLREAIESYQGVERRFDIQYRSESKTYIDDYAHHPEELNATINSIKELYPNKKVLGIFQPHLFTRTQDFATGFAQSLDLLDECIIMPIYPAREEPIEGVTSELILTQMKNTSAQIVWKDAIVDSVLKSDCEVILTLGAGNIDQLVQPIKEALK